MIKRKLTKDEAEKLIRADAKAVGLMFKREGKYIGNHGTYKLVDKATGRDVLTGRTFWGMYEQHLNGFIASYNKTTKLFDWVPF